MTYKFQFELGRKLRCKVTGYEGIATSFVVYLNGCIQYALRPRIGDDGKYPDCQYIDQETLEYVDENTKIDVPVDAIGGPSCSPSSMPGTR